MLITIVLLLYVGVFVCACAKAAPPVIRDFGPTKTKAGQQFNVSNGTSAIWIKADNVTKDTVIVWGDRKVPSFKESYGISAPIPRELYSKPGQYKLYLLDTRTGDKSNSVVFTVE